MPADAIEDLADFPLERNSLALSERDDYGLPTAVFPKSGTRIFADRW